MTILAAPAIDDGMFKQGRIDEAAANGFAKEWAAGKMCHRWNETLNIVEVCHTNTRTNEDTWWPLRWGWN